MRVTDRLTDSPACLAIGDFDMGPQMRRILAASGQAVPDAKPILEINPAHPLVQRLDGEQDEAKFADVARVLLDQATLAEGRPLRDPGGFRAAAEPAADLNFGDSSLNCVCAIK